MLPKARPFYLELRNRQHVNIWELPEQRKGLLGESVYIIILDTLIALMSGMVIFPLVLLLASMLERVLV